MNNQFSKNALFWVLACFTLIIIFNLAQGSYFTDNKVKLTLSELLSKIDNKEIAKAQLQGYNVDGVLSDGQHFTSYTGGQVELADRLYMNGIAVEVLPMYTKMQSFISILLSWIPMLLPIAIWVLVMRQMNTGGSRAFGFGKSKAKLLSDKAPKVTFKDVAGIDEAKEEVTELVDFLRDPSKFQKLGGRIPRGCLLIGPPGTGKTLLARAIAGEANVPFFSISGSDFVEMFVGVGASRVRDMFEQGKRHAPCIIFIDEIDAVGRHRGASVGGGNDEREQTLNQMLVEMDGFDPNEGVVIIAATNRPDVLDAALTRPGRFDRQVFISEPDIKGREQILKVHLSKIKTADNVNSLVLAQGTPGLSGAELANLINEAALIAARRNKKLVDNDDLEFAKDKVCMGVERRSRVMTYEQKLLTAYHEAGHAIVGVYTKSPRPIHKATILPRGQALGMVVRLQEQDTMESRDQIESDIAVSMGGRAAEAIIFGEDKITTGASGDIQNASARARAMVRYWGMSEALGMVLYNSDKESSQTAALIDQEVQRIVKQGYDIAKETLTTRLEDLHKLAKALIERETLTGEEIKRLLSLPQSTPVDSKDQHSAISETA